MTSIYNFICALAMLSTPACFRSDASRPSDNISSNIATVDSNAAFESANVFNVSVPSDDATLFATRRQDRQDRASNLFTTLSVSEHMRRAAIFMTNRAFDEARTHWQIVLTNYPNDANIPSALWGIGRSYYQQRHYADALPFFERLGRDYATTKEGRDGFYYVAPTLLRMGRASDAAARYIEYTQKFPLGVGERIDDAYLNVIDTMREAEQTDEALKWVDITRQKFPNMTITTKALFARLRLEVAEKEWAKAIATSDDLLKLSLTRDTGTSNAEVTYLRAYSLENAGRAAEAIATYTSIPDGASSYYGYAVNLHLQNIMGASAAQAQQAKNIAAVRNARARREIVASAAQYPVPYRNEILHSARAHGIDPRFMLAIMRQESSFKPRAKSPAAARGLMQLTFDAAQTYAPHAGYANLKETDLYDPAVSIEIASLYFLELDKMFPNFLEASAASYNGGEDNAARWLTRSKAHDAGTFAAEVGYSETKDYVAKVMANYRAYKSLYDAQLRQQF